MKKKRLKILFIFCLLLIVILVSIPLALQTRPVKNWLATLIENNINKNLNATLSIGRIDGNFFSSLELSGVAMTFEKDTIAIFPSIALKYDLQPLLKKKIAVSSFTIHSPKCFVYQFPDSSWVFEHFVKTPSKEKAREETGDKPDSSSFEWTVELEKFELINLNAEIAAFDSLIPRQINNLNISLAGLFGPDLKRLNLHNISFETRKPDITLSTLRFLFEQNREGVILEAFEVETARNKLSANAQMFSDFPTEAHADINTSPVDFSEFHFILPTINFSGRPKIDVASRLNSNKLETTLQISSPSSTIGLEAVINSFSFLTGDSTQSEPDYDISGSLKNITLSDWLNIEPSVQFNGDLSLKGSGISSRTAKFDLKVRLAGCKIEHRIIEQLTLVSSYDKGALEALFDLSSDMGNVNGKAQISDALARQNFIVTLNGRNLDLAPITLDSTLVSDLNFDLQAHGSSFSPSDMTGELDLHVQPSRIYDTEIDTLAAALRFAEKDIKVESFRVQNSAVDLNAAGTLSLDSANDLELTLKTGDLMTLNHFMNADTIDGSAQILAHISGTLDSLTLAATVDADSILYDSYLVDSLEMNITGQKLENDLFGAAQANINKISTGDILIQDVHLDTDLTPERLNIKTGLRQGEKISALLHAQYYLNELPIIYIKQLDVDLFGRQWRGGSENTSIMLGDKEYIVSNFLIKRIDGDTTNAQIYIDGTIRLDGEEEFQLRVDNYHLSPLSEFLQDHPVLNGVLNLDVKLAGTADQPKLSAKMSLSEIQYNDIFAKKLNGSVDYEKDQINTNILLIPKTDSLTIKADIPAHFSLADQSFIILETKPFEIAIEASDIPLENILSNNAFFSGISGFLDINIHAENTLSDILPRGYITIEEGLVQNDKYGIELNDLDMELLVKPDSLVLQQFKAVQKAGWIRLNGFAALDRSIFSGIVNALRLDIMADHFYLSTKPEHEIQIDSKININGPLDSLKYAGNLEIIRSSFYLPALTGNSSNQKKSRETPLLLQALSTQSDSLTADTTITIAAKKEAPPILKNLRGTLKVNIPRNTWFKSDNMRVEISGDVDIIKNSEFFELFGPINVLRGQYDFLARRFKLSEGTVNFQGGERINPMLNVTAEYTFRDSNKDKRTVYLVVTDEALQPEIRFKLDNDDITEGEAVSYILFNRSPDEMGGTSTDSPSQTGYLATDLVYGMMSAELSRRFSRQLGVDYIEIKGEDNLNTATFIVGKYITPDLFMSYEHSIGSMEEDRPPQVVTVEYQLTKYVFFQLISGDTKSTGADLIFKFDK